MAEPRTPDGAHVGIADGALDDTLVDALVQASFLTMAVLNRVAAEHDLSLTQVRVMAILRDRRLRMTELADYLGLEKSTMTGLVDRAEKRGLMRRTPNRDDGRAIDVVLTPAGHELAERGHHEVEQALSAHTRRISHAEQRELQTLLERMTRA